MPLPRSNSSFATIRPNVLCKAPVSTRPNKRLLACTQAQPPSCGSFGIGNRYEELKELLDRRGWTREVYQSRFTVHSFKPPFPNQAIALQHFPGSEPNLTRWAFLPDSAEAISLEVSLDQHSMKDALVL